MSKTLIIDAGHGGNDPGASGFGVKEKDWTLKISLYQYNRLKELGANVAITRTNDKTLDSNARTALIRNKYDYCMSNHFNAFDGTARGVETIHSIHAKDTIAKRLADVIVKASGLPLRRVFTRKLKNGQDYYYMHRLTGNTQTVIVEYGFIDNKTDHNWYKNEDNFYKVAEAVVKEWCSILGVKYVAPGKKQESKPKPKGKLYKVQIGAYSEKANADNQAKKAKSKGFDVYQVKEGGLHKVQIGAYSKLENAQAQADKARKAGFDIYIENSGSGSTSSKLKTFKVGQKVRIKQSAKKYSRANVTIPARVKSKRYTIQQVAKNDVLLKEIVSWVNKVDVE